MCMENFHNQYWNEMIQDGTLTFWEAIGIHKDEVEADNEIKAFDKEMDVEWRQEKFEQVFRRISI